MKTKEISSHSSSVTYGFKTVAAIPYSPLNNKWREVSKDLVAHQKKGQLWCNSNTVQALFKYRVTVMKYRLSPAAVLFSKTEDNN